MKSNTKTTPDQDNTLKTNKKQLVIKNRHLNPLIKAITYDTFFAQGRARDRFLKPVIERAITVEKNRKEICMKLCLKDGDSKPILTQDGNGGEVFTFDAEGHKSADLELIQLSNEDLIIERNFILDQDLKHVNSLIESSKVILTPEESKMVVNFLYFVTGKE